MLVGIVHYQIHPTTTSCAELQTQDWEQLIQNDGRDGYFFKKWRSDVEKDFISSNSKQLLIRRMKGDESWVLKIHLTQKIGRKEREGKMPFFLILQNSLQDCTGKGLHRERTQRGREEEKYCLFYFFISYLFISNIKSRVWRLLLIEKHTAHLEIVLLITCQSIV